MPTLVLIGIMQLCMGPACGVSAVFGMHAVDANSSFLKMLQLHVYKVGSFSRLLSLCSDSNNVSVANSAAYK